MFLYNSCVLKISVFENTVTLLLLSSKLEIISHKLAVMVIYLYSRIMHLRLYLSVFILTHWQQECICNTGIDNWEHKKQILCSCKIESLYIIDLQTHMNS
jgi:hypothetical protein